jgi:endonuclease/exonuclease/phosphatase family metal-dependent hydrolase
MSSASALLLWWNVGNLFDDEDDPRTRDHLPSTREYHRDLQELADVLGGVEPCPALIGLGEVENKRVLDDLGEELRWHPKRRDFVCPEHHESRDPRGIDVGLLLAGNGALRLDRTEALWPSDRSAVRPIVLAHGRLGGERLRVALVHSKSQRSGASHRSDPTPGSKARFAYGRLLRDLANDAGNDGVPLVVLGDFNEEPNSPALVEGASARLGRTGEAPRANRLYNLSDEMAADHPGTHCHQGRWSFLDQVLVNGLLLGQGKLRIDGRPRVFTGGPLLYQGRPNRWYSDHLPIAIRIRSA